MRGPTQQLLDTHTTKKARNRFPNRAPKFCLVILADHLANDASTATFHDITTDQQDDECNKTFHDWRVHNVVIDRAQHDDRQTASRILAGATEPDTNTSSNFTQTNDHARDRRKAKSREAGQDHLNTHQFSNTAADNNK